MSRSRPHPVRPPLPHSHHVRGTAVRRALGACGAGPGHAHSRVPFLGHQQHPVSVVQMAQQGHIQLHILGLVEAGSRPHQPLATASSGSAAFAGRQCCSTQPGSFCRPPIIIIIIIMGHPSHHHVQQTHHPWAQGAAGLGFKRLPDWLCVPTNHPCRSC